MLRLKPIPETSPLEQLSATERLRIISLDEAAHLSSLSVESILRHHSSKVIALSPRRKGMRVADALSLVRSEQPA